MVCGDAATPPNGCETRHRPFALQSHRSLRSREATARPRADNRSGGQLAVPSAPDDTVPDQDSRETDAPQVITVATRGAVVRIAVAAGHLGFPRGEQWLYVGPGGPHIIGKVAAHLAHAVGSGDPFSVDFDARWAKKLTDGSFARDRYAQHVVDQAMTVIESQEIGVLFITPVVLARLATLMTVEQRERVKGVHYAGMAISPQELERFQIELFPNAVHLSGYGNTLFGCCLELAAVDGRPLDYYPQGNRLLLEVVDDRGEPVPDGEIGTVRFTRLDESMLLVRMVERDEASRVALPDSAPKGYALPGVRNPSPRASVPQNVSLGLY